MSTSSAPPNQLPSQTDVAVLGSGPVGLDAALALHKQKRDFLVLEAGQRPAAGIRAWGSVQLFSPWSMNLSQRMRGALAEAGHAPPEDETCPTGNELCDQALDLIASTPAIAERLHCGVRVLAVGREGLLKREHIGSEHRAEQRFRILVGTAAGERIVYAKAVLDCTGSHQPLWAGASGIPAMGERALAERGDPRLIRTLGDFVQRDPHSWRDRRVLLIGAGHSAQTAAVRLVEQGAKLSWAVRNQADVAGIEDDPLPERSRLQEQARVILERDDASARILRHCVIESLVPAETTPEQAPEETTEQRAVRNGEGPINVTLNHREPRSEANQPPTALQLTVDSVIALVGAAGDAQLYRELQVQECYATTGPMRLAAALLGEEDPDNAGDCLAQVSQGPETLITPEPGYFILGVKSYGRNNAFLLRIGYEQVSDAVSLL